MYALSTSGSIIGTFLPVAVLIPADRDAAHDARDRRLLALAASPVLGRRYLLVPALIGAVALVPPGPVKPGGARHLRGRVGLPVHPGAVDSQAAAACCI